MKLSKMLFSKIFYRELFIILISMPFLIYQIIVLSLNKNGDTIRLVCKKK